MVDGGFARSNQIIYSKGVVVTYIFDPYFPAFDTYFPAFDTLTLSDLTSLELDETRNAYGILSGGYGLGCFCYFSAFVLSLASTILISPYFGGSPNEIKIINAPFEVVG